MNPCAFEFSLRASTTLGGIQELYAITTDARPERTLAEVLSDKLRTKLNWWARQQGRGLYRGKSPASATTYP